MKQSEAGLGRQLLRAVRHGPDRLLHALRRRRARQLLAVLPRRVVFVCHGNICRSPYAAAAFARALAQGSVTGVTVESAGLMGPGRPAPETAQRVAEGRGVPLATHRSRLLNAEDAAADTVIVVMEAWQLRAVRARIPQAQVVLLGDLDPAAIDTRAVIDPINRDAAFFSRVYDRIDRCTGALAGLWSGRRS